MQTASISERYARDYPAVFRVIHTHNQGLGPARNTGIRAAAGQSIGFVDADDWVEPEMYGNLYEKAIKTGADIVFCDVKKIFVERGTEVVDVSMPEESDDVDIAEYIQNGLNPAYSWNRLYKREIWERNQFNSWCMRTSTSCSQSKVTAARLLMCRSL